MITVVVPVYNVEKYLNRCVDSILNQTYKDFELLLVDDGSPDKCGKICDALVPKYNNIIALYQENHGQATARNNGVKIAHSEWSHFVDSDDLIHTQLLESFYNAVIKNSVKLAMCSAVQNEKDITSFYSEKK